MYVKRVDPDEYAHEKMEVDKMASDFGMKPPEVMPVDMNYSFVPVNLTQEDKSSNKNLQATHKENMARFGYEVYEE